MSITRTVVAFCALIVAAALSGCASGTSPYGSTVLIGGANSGTEFSGELIDVKSGVKVVGDRELLPVYVQAPIITPGALDNIDRFDRDAFSELTIRSTQEALAGFGRFATVMHENQAMLIVEPRVIAAIPWKDTVTRKQGFDVGDNPGMFGASRGTQDVKLEREGIDLGLSLTFKKLDGSFIATGYATGRLSAVRGDIIRTAETVVDKSPVKVDDFQKLDQADLDQSRLATVVYETTRGVIIVMLKQIDGQWWTFAEGNTGLRPVNEAVVLVETD